MAVDGEGKQDVARRLAKGVVAGEHIDRFTNHYRLGNTDRSAVSGNSVDGFEILAGVVNRSIISKDTFTQSGSRNPDDQVRQMPEARRSWAASSGAGLRLRRSFRGGGA